MFRKLLLVMIGVVSISTTASAQEAITFVLVHGVFQDHSSWDEVIPLLEADGYSAIAVELPGRGEDTTPPGEVTLNDYRDTVIEVVEQQAGSVILVGHSFGGITISEVAEAIPDQVALLVYVAAYLPQNGDSSAGLANLDRNNGFNEENFLISEDFTVASVLEADYLTIFCGDCDEAQGTVVFEERQDEPLGPLNETVSVTDANFGEVAKAYVLTAEDNAISPQMQIFMLSRTSVDRVFAMNTSHVPFTVQPRQLASILLQAIPSS